MSTNFNFIVNKSEADALKEMIFKRAQERSKAYTEDVQSDIMDLARESFDKGKNPFAGMVTETPQEEVVKKENNTNKDNEIGFPQKESSAIQNIKNQNSVIKEQIIQSTIQSTMRDAKAELQNNKTFMGALNFINSQAAVSLLRTRADRFEMIV